MGFVTAIYNGCIPLVQTSVFFQDVYPVGILNNGLTSKFRIVLEDGNTWLLYFSLQLGVNPLSFTQTSNTTIEGPHNYFGVVQVAKLSSGCSEEFYDRSAGAYAVGLNIPARVCGNQGTYTLTWDKAGSPKPLLMYALPHHVSSFTEVTKPNVTPLRLMTTTKGMATGVLADVWQMEEHLPIDMGFTPWMPWTYLTAQVTPAAAATIAEAGKVEAEQDVLSQCNVDNLYFSGKGLAKFAMMAIALNTMAGQKELAKKVLDKLKQAFDLFVQNKQKTPLVYDRSWGGVVSKGSMENAEADFGNAYYNDHHFVGRD
jgi:endo-1,3(4)-beta-glucanase